MRITAFLIIVSSFTVLFSSAALAHQTGSDSGLIGSLLHNFTGEHLLMLIAVGVCAICVSRLYQR